MLRYPGRSQHPTQGPRIMIAYPRAINGPRPLWFQLLQYPTLQHPTLVKTLEGNNDYTSLSSFLFLFSSLRAANKWLVRAAVPVVASSGKRWSICSVSSSTSAHAVKGDLYDWEMLGLWIVDKLAHVIEEEYQSRAGCLVACTANASKQSKWQV